MEKPNEASTALAVKDEVATREEEVTEILRQSALNNYSGADTIAIPKQYRYKVKDRLTVKEVFNAIFDLIDGVPRIGHWARQNPEAFLALYARVMIEAEKGANQHAGAHITINTGMPHSPLSNVEILDIEDLDEDGLPK